jgi:hypothetical protein
MLPILTSDLYNYLALAVMLLAILFGYRKGRDGVSVSSQSLAWTQVPLIAFAIASIGPSAFAIIIYLGYKFGLIQPEPSGYSFSIFIRELPFDFAVINWGFVALYSTCRLHLGTSAATTRSAKRQKSPKASIVRGAHESYNDTGADSSRLACWPAGHDLGEWWPSRLVATAAKDRLNIRPLAGSEICDLFRGCAPNVRRR